MYFGDMFVYYFDNCNFCLFVFILWFEKREKDEVLFLEF